MDFFRTFAKSISRPSFYQNIKGRSIEAAFGYFALLSVLMAATASLGTAPGLFGFFSRATLDEVVNLYPADLVITAKDGTVTTNQEEPYFVPNPEIADKEDLENVLVIDTASDFSYEQFASYSTYVLVKKDFVVGQGSGAPRIIPLEDANFTLSRDVLTGWADAAEPYMSLVAFITLLFVTLALTIFNLFHLLYLLPIVLLVWGMHLLFKHPYGYGDWFKVGIYALTLPLVISTGLFLFGVTLPLLGFTLILLLVMNFYAWKGSA